MTPDRCRQASMEFVTAAKNQRAYLEGRMKDVSFDLETHYKVEKLKMLTEESKVAALYEIAAQLSALNENLFRPTMKITKTTSGDQNPVMFPNRD